MRRLAVTAWVLTTLALAPALVVNIAQASVRTNPTPAYDLGTMAFRATFGESSDAQATLAASYGDRASESPLRDLAIRVHDVFRPRGAVPALVAPLAFLPDRIALLPSFAAPNPADSGVHFYAPSLSQFTPVAFYAPVPSIVVDAPERVATGTLPPAATGESAATTSTVAVPAPSIRFGSSAFDEKPSSLAGGLAPASVIVPVSVHVGRLDFDGQYTGSETQAPGSSSSGENASTYDAGANFNVRAGGHRVNVDVSSSYEHLMHDDTMSSTPALPSAAQWEVGALPALPTYSDMSRLALGADVAVPVTRTVTLGLNYNAQRLLGEYGLPNVGSLDAMDNSYGGKVTFAIPRWSSELSVSAGQYHYQDNLAPANAFSGLGGNVNLTVKL